MLTHTKSLKLKKYPGENVKDCCTTIVVDSARRDSSGAFNPNHLKYTTHIFEDASDSKFCPWDIQKYKEVTEFIKKICVCDMDVISKEDLITYKSLVQEATHEYRNLVNSKR